MLVVLRSSVERGGWLSVLNVVTREGVASKIVDDE
jgi:hypothetical protein